MPNKNVIPSTQDDFRAWSQHLNNHIGSQNVIGGQEQQDLSQSCALIVASYDAVKNAEANLKAAVENKNLVEAAQMPIVSGILNKIKKSPNYNLAVGRALDIVTRQSSPNDLQSIKPNPKLVFAGSQVVIRYTKGKTEGVRIYCRRGGESQFTPLDRNSAAPFIDNRPNLNGANSEKREYYLIYMKSNQEIGQRSDVVSINVEL